MQRQKDALMLLTLAEVLTQQDQSRTLDEISRLAFVDGRETAGWSARLVKDTTQAARDPLSDAIILRITEALLASDVLRIAAVPKRIIGPMLTRYEMGNAYGTHVDDAILDGSRADLSFTLFLSDPSTYDGGDLVIEGPDGEHRHKLDGGSLLLYPATTLHRVEPVTRGKRYAAVGWIRSYVRSAEQRELLFDLETARRLIFESEGKTHEFDLLAKCAANLLRMWGDD